MDIKLLRGLFGVPQIVSSCKVSDGGSSLAGRGVHRVAVSATRGALRIDDSALLARTQVPTEETCPHRGGYSRSLSISLAFRCRNACPVFHSTPLYLSCLTARSVFGRRVAHGHAGGHPGLAARPVAHQSCRPTGGES